MTISRNSGFKKMIVVLFFLQAFFTCTLYSQTLDYSAHATIIYYMTKYFDWPESAKTGDFEIGIYGDSIAYAQFKKLIVYKRLGNQNITVVKINDFNNLKNCNMLFVTEQKSKEIKKISELTKNKPILIITQKEGVLLKGSCMNFGYVDEKLKIEINKGNIEKRSIKIARELLGMVTE